MEKQKKIGRCCEEGDMWNLIWYMTGEPVLVWKQMEELNPF